MTDPTPSLSTEKDQIAEALVEALYGSKIGEYGYLGRPECEQFIEPLLPVVERVLAERVARASKLGERHGIQYAIGLLLGVTPPLIDVERILNLLRQRRDRASVVTPPGTPSSGGDPS